MEAPAPVLLLPTPTRQPADGRMVPGWDGASGSAGWKPRRACEPSIDGCWSPPRLPPLAAAPTTEATTPRKAASQSPTPVCPAHQARPKQSKSRLTRRQGRDSRCSQQCVGDSPVQRRNGTLGTTQLGAGGAGLGGKYAGQDSVTSTRGTTPSDPPPARAAAEQ